MKITMPPVAQDIFLNDSLPDNQKNAKKRGAVVLGTPKSKELTSFLDSINPEFNNQRLMSMFFSGQFITEDYSEDGE